MVFYDSAQLITNELSYKRKNILSMNYKPELIIKYTEQLLIPFGLCFFNTGLSINIEVGRVSSIRFLRIDDLAHQQLCF